MTKDRKKYIEEFWHKYEAMNALEAELPPTPRELVFELMNSVHRARLNSGKSSVLIELDIEHHIAMQKAFKKWREVLEELLAATKFRRKK
jgi:hypothetical protein